MAETQSKPALGPVLAAFMIGIAAEILFLINLARPSTLLFDEVHYVPAARALLALSGPANVEHPLLGKELIALGIMLGGDNSFGWRIFSTLAATAVVLGIFAILWLLFGRLRTASVGALIVVLNFTVFIQARIAMLDGFMAAFVVTGIAALLWAMRGDVLRRWVLGSALLGLGVACKWAAVPYVAYAGLAFLVVRRRDGGAWPGLRTVPALLLLSGVSIATYFLTFTPAFFYTSEPMTLSQLLPFQAEMYARQTQILPPHTYQSRWWTWPLDIRPIWYLYEPVDGAVRGVLMLGNPAIMWGGLIAVAACLYAWWRDAAPKLGLTALLWIASFAVWIIIPKSIGFFYYYYLPSIFLALPLAAAFQHFGTGKWRNVDHAFLALAGGLFVWFYPIISAAALPNDQAFLHWMWFDSWR